jgi:pimeloyl-ACP methyl ester carboxylesterase
MTRAPAPGNLERRIREAERAMFAGIGVDVEESFVELGRTGRRVRILAHGQGPAVLLLHGVSLSAAAWAPLFAELASFRLLAVDLPGHGLSDPVAYGRGQVREQTGEFMEQLLDSLELDRAPAIGHSLGAMVALWHAAAGSRRLSTIVAMGAPAVALAGVRVRMPLSLMTVRHVGPAFLSSPAPLPVYRRLLAQGLGAAEVARAPDGLVEALRLAARRRANARSVASMMHAIDRFRRPRVESVLADAELASITTPCVFILGSDDPYLSVERARVSIGRIPTATVHEVAGAHGPWLVDPRGVARLAVRSGLSGVSPG